MTSRRWEAFRLGVEDFDVIKDYEGSFGKEATRNLVKEVVSRPSDLNLADLIKNKMILELLQAGKISDNDK